MPKWFDTCERDSVILSLDADGLKPTDIVPEAGCSIATVRRVLADAYGPRTAGRQKGYRDPQAERLRAEAIRLRGLGWTTARIAAEIDRSESVVRGYLRRQSEND